MRVDDFPGTKPVEFHKHNLDSFKVFDEILRENCVNEYYLGMIPAYIETEHYEFFKENEHIIPAVHGLIHDERKVDEFDGMCKGDITHRLNVTRISMENLIGRKIDTYIPPHNYIKYEHLMLLAMAGFKRLMVGPGLDDKLINTLNVSQYEIELMQSYPPYEYGRTDELAQIPSVEKMESELEENQSVLFTLHFPWEVNIGFEYLKSFMQRMAPLFKEYGT